MWTWPLRSTPVWPDLPGQFGSARKYDIHTGVDLYTELGTEVLAVEAGVVVGIHPFTGEDAGSPWWNRTSAVIVRGESGYVLYGEIQPSCTVGESLSQGQVLGVVAVPVLPSYKGRPQVMLHLELNSGENWADIWIRDRPQGLLDPSPLLLEANNPVHFDITQYPGESFRGVCIASAVVRIHSEGRILLLRRNLDAPWFPNQWCFPGGVRKDILESAVETARRETWEETRLRVSWLTPAGEFFAYAPQKVFRVSVFDAEVPGRPRPRLSYEHRGYKWYTPGTPLTDVPENTLRLLQTGREVSNAL